MKLYGLYKDIVTLCPISFGCIPYVGAHHLTPSKNGKAKTLDAQWIKWQTKAINPIDNNVELIQLLKDWISKGRATIIMHGINHNLHEFEEKVFLLEEVKQALEYLEFTFAKRISVTSFPNNSINSSMASILKKCDLNFIISYGFRPLERKLSCNMMMSFLKLLWFFIRHGYSKRFPFLLKVNNKMEHTSYELGPNSKIKELTEAFDFAYDQKGSFVLATHYYHLWNDSHSRIVLDQFLEHTRKFSGVEYCVAEKLFCDVVGNKI